MTAALHAVAHVAGAAYVAIAVLMFAVRVPLVVRVVIGAWRLSRVHEVVITAPATPGERVAREFRRRITRRRAFDYATRAVALALVCALLWFIPGRLVVSRFT